MGEKSRLGTKRFANSQLRNLSRFGQIGREKDPKTRGSEGRINAVAGQAVGQYRGRRSKFWMLLAPGEGERKRGLLERTGQLWQSVQQKINAMACAWRKTSAWGKRAWADIGIDLQKEGNKSYCRMRLGVKKARRACSCAPGMGPARLPDKSVSKTELGEEAKTPGKGKSARTLETKKRTQETRSAVLERGRGR